MNKDSNNNKNEFDVLFNISLSLLCIFDMDGNLLRINKTWEQVLGYSENELLEKKYLALVHPDELELTYGMLEQLITQGKITGHVNRLMKKKGDFRLFKWQAELHNDHIYAAAIDITDRVASESKLRTSEGRFSQLFYNSPIGLLYYDKQGTITECNDAFVSIIGSSREMLQGLNMLNLPDKRVVEAVSATLDGKKVEKLEIDYASVTADKTTPVRLLFSPVTSAAGTVEGGVGIIEDISERLAAEKQIKKSMENYQALFEQSVDGILLGNQEGIIIDANKSIESLTGYLVDEVIGENIKNFFDPSLLAQKPLDYKAVFEGKTVLSERELRKKDGTVITVEMNTRKLPDGRLQSCMRDVTERKKAERALRMSENRLKRFFELNPYSIQITDSKGYTLHVNAACKQLFGSAPPPEYSIFSDPVLEKQGLLDKLKEVLKGETVYMPEFSYNTIEVAPDLPDNPIWLQMVVFPLLDMDKNVEMIIIMHENITEKHVLKERLKHSEKMEAIGQLAGGIAHDFNNMLSGIMGGASLLEKHVVSDKGKKFLSIINESAKRTADLTHKLLTFGRKGNTKFQAENINNAIDNTIEILKYTLDRKINIHSHYEKDPVFVWGNIAQLQNVFINMGINAAHAMETGGQLTYRSKVVCLKEPTPETKPGWYVQVDVEDTGVGIPPEYHQKIFEPFFTTRDISEGAGLGLATVYGTIKDHQGSIRLESETEKGTVFHIYLPLLPEETLAFAREEKEDLQKEEHSGCVLLVEDEKLVRNINTMILERLGYKVYTAENGKQGVQSYLDHQNEIDFVILDMVMPKMNGRECFLEIKKIDPSAVIVMASGFTQDKDSESMKNLGLAAFIQKPFSIDELETVISSLKLMGK